MLTPSVEKRLLDCGVIHKLKLGLLKNKAFFINCFLSYPSK